jgi:hypothetical protein
MSLVYSEISIGQRLTPLDAIKRESVDGVIFEKEKYQKEWCENNG